MYIYNREISCLVRPINFEIMKIPSLTRIPSHKRFNIEPRYYDPVKEDIAERTSRIKQEISQLAEGQLQHGSGISGSFSKRTSTNHARNANILQMIIMIILITFLGGYLLYGNYIFYALLLVIPVYFFVRLRNYPKRR